MELPVIQRFSQALRVQRVEREFGIEALVRMLETYLPDEHVAEVRRAAEFATRVHAGQSRSSGEPYVYHPLAAARILAEMRMDPTTLMAAILHDVIEDTSVSKRILQEQFGLDVAELVDGVSKIDKIEGMSRAERARVHGPLQLSLGSRLSQAAAALHGAPQRLIRRVRPVGRLAFDAAEKLGQSGCTDAEKRRVRRGSGVECDRARGEGGLGGAERAGRRGPREPVRRRVKHQD